MTISCLQIKEYVKQGIFSPFYVINGDDFYLCNSVVLELENIVVHKTLNIVYFDNSDLGSILKECSTIPFIDSYKLIFCKNIKLKAMDIKTINKYLDNPNPSVILIFSSLNGVLDNNKIVTIDCAKLPPNSIFKIIKDICISNQVEIEQDAIVMLVEYCNNDMTLISQELKKLIAYHNGTTIQSSSIQLLVTPTVEYGVFALSDAFGNKQNEKAIKILFNLLDKGEEPIALNGLLYTHFRRMLMCCITNYDPKNVEYIGVKEWALDKLNRQAKLFGAKVLRDICGKFWTMDNDFRQGKVPLADTTLNIMLDILSI